MKRHVLYILYKRLRPSIGLTFGFVLMSSMMLNTPSIQLLHISLGFFLIALFGDFYNDYWDYDEDTRNEKKDKFTTSGYITPGTSKNISYALVIAGILMLWPINIYIFSLAVAYATLLIFYSHPAVRLKGSLKGYMALSSFFFLMPFGIMVSFGSAFSLIYPLSGMFFFFQYTYILCQKDSTDTKDDTNLFLNHKWSTSSKITVLFASLSSLSLLLISFIHPTFLLFWAMNSLAKAFNVQRIVKMSITRTLRQRLISLEFLTPYLYIGGGLIV